jgi:hypothetical protein
LIIFNNRAGVLTSAIGVIKSINLTLHMARAPHARNNEENLVPDDTRREAPVLRRHDVRVRPIAHNCTDDPSGVLTSANG